MARQFTISLIWVPGHRDIVGNCIADELARQGTIMPLLPGKEKVGMPMATCKLNLKNYFNKLANTHWQNAPQWRISHQTWPLINNKRASELLKFSRTECGMLVWALTDHWLVGTQAGRLKAPKMSSLEASLLLPSLMQTQNETFRKPFHRRSYRNIGD